jgi:N-succinyldiaminopimelate aminotransferase
VIGGLAAIDIRAEVGAPPIDRRSKPAVSIARRDDRRHGMTRLAGLGESIFSTMSAMAREHGAIDLGQGFPDFDPPAQMVEAAAAAMRDGLNQYAPSVGAAALREAVGRHALAHYGLEYDPATEITITAGATEGIWCAVFALLGEGDEAVIVEPFYELYPACVRAAGAEARYVRTSFPDFRIDPDDLRAAFSERTRLVVLNTPGNPSGVRIDADTLRLVGELAREHDAYVLSDETYEHIVFGAAGHLPAALGTGCPERTITVSAISKTFSATGWRVGWVLAPPELTEAVRRVHQNTVFAAPTPLQAAAAEMLDAAAEGDFYARLRADYEHRHDLLLDLLGATGLHAARPDGAYFLMVQTGGDDVAYCNDLITRVGVGAIPASHFFHDRADGRGLVRFAFCKSTETLVRAGERLAAARPS